MTKKIITSYSAFICMAVMMVGTATVQASEVTGTLSSDTSNVGETDGNIGGTVSSDEETSGSLEGTVSSDSSRSGGSSSSRGGSGSSSNAPSGSVLGASTDNTQTPSFPNAGFAPEEGYTDQPLWSAMIAFFKNMFSF